MTTRSLDKPAERTNQGLWPRLPWFSRLVMVPPALIMLMVSARYIFNPAHAAAPIGVSLTTPDALTDTRVVGGLTFTIAFVIASAIFSPGALRFGHAIIVVLMAAILLVRMFGFAQDGTTFAMGDQKLKTIGESAFLILNSFGFLLQTLRMRQIEAQS